MRRPRRRTPTLWDGADVVWDGPERTIDGTTLRPGDRLVVVDAGRHHVGSFGGMVLLEDGTRPTRPGRGVAVRTAAGAVVRVAAARLRVVAPDHPLRPEPDAGLAAWWLDQLEPDWRGGSLPVAALVPRSLPAVCRVLHPWRDHAGGLVRWEDAEHATDPDDLSEPTDGRLEVTTATRLTQVLGPATSAPDDVLVAVWEGWGDVPPERFPGAGRVAVPARGHLLLRGPLDGVRTSVSAWHWSEDAASGVWWPADRAWLVHTEIDLPWTFVAGSHALVDALLAHPDLEVRPSSHDDAANRLDGR